MELYKKQEEESGCLLAHFALELSDTHPEIRMLCAGHFGQWAKTFKRDLDGARAKYSAKKPIDTQSLAEYFIAILEGSLIISKAKQDRRVLEKSLQHFKEYLKVLFEKKS